MFECKNIILFNKLLFDTITHLFSEIKFRAAENTLSDAALLVPNALQLNLYRRGYSSLCEFHHSKTLNSSLNFVMQTVSYFNNSPPIWSNWDSF